MSQRTTTRPAGFTAKNITLGKNWLFMLVLKRYLSKLTVKSITLPLKWTVKIFCCTRLSTPLTSHFPQSNQTAWQKMKNKHGLAKKYFHRLLGLRSNDDN